MQAETGELPELKRVLVSDGVRVVMEENLATALEVLFGTSKQVVVEKEEISATVEEAQTYYDLIEDAMQQGDWTGIGDNLDKLGSVLEALRNS